MSMKTKTYKQYKEAYIKKHGTHGLMSEETWTKRNKRKSTIFCVADFETTAPDTSTTGEILLENQTLDSEAFFNPSEKSQVFLVGYKFNIDDEIYITYENLEDFFNGVSKWCKAKGLNKIKVYFHNLKFDGSFILSYLLRHNFRQTLERNRWGKPIINYKEFQALISAGKWFTLAFKWNGIKLELLDSLKLNPASLRSIGETYKMYKGEADYSQFKLDKSHNYPQEWIEYLKQDVRITEAIMLNHLKHGENLNKMTIGACAYEKIKYEINKHTPVYTIADYQRDEKGYYGGQCICNPYLQGKWIRQKGKIRCKDAKSMYPSRLREDLPYGNGLSRKPKCKYTMYHHVIIRQADIKEKYKSLQILHVPNVYKNGKRYKLVEHKDITYISHLDYGEYDYYLWDDELKFLNKIYNIDYEIVETTYYKVAPYLKEIVEELYINKRDATSKIERNYWKLIVNNLYGKLGMKPFRDMDFYGEKWRVNNKYIIKGEKLKELTINHYPALLLTENKKLDDDAKQVFIASYVTSRARVCLNTEIKRQIDKGNTFLYCDTDSVFYVENVPDEYNIGEELGNWGYEDFKVINTKNPKMSYNCTRADGFISLAPKHYRVVMDYVRYPVKMGSAGCDKKEMFEVKNTEYNYELILAKPKLILGNAGYIVGSTEYNFRKYAELIHVDIPPKEFRYYEI